MDKKTKNKLITGMNFTDFDWNKSKMFYHIAKCGSFLKAARLAGTDTATLTRQIQSLEKQVGCPLLIRKTGATGGIFLTRKGEELVEMVGMHFLRTKGFCGPAYIEVGGKKKRKIRIVTTHALAAYVISDLIAAYKRKNPHLVFEIIGEDHEIDVILSDADIAIRPYDPKAVGIHQEHLFTLQKKLYASEAYLKEYGEPTTVEELNHHHFLSYPISIEHSDYPYSDVAWVLKVGMPESKLRKPVFTSNSIECLVNEAKDGTGIMSGYEQMSIFRDSGLIIILPNINGNEIKEYFICPDYLMEDIEITKIKNYLKEGIQSGEN